MCWFFTSQIDLWQKDLYDWGCEEERSGAGPDFFTNSAAGESLNENHTVKYNITKQNKTKKKTHDYFFKNEMLIIILTHMRC